MHRRDLGFARGLSRPIAVRTGPGRGALMLTRQARWSAATGRHRRGLASPSSVHLRTNGTHILGAMEYRLTHLGPLGLGNVRGDAVRRRHAAGDF